MIISIEGADGTGKTSICRLVSARMKEAGVNFIALREPGSTTLGASIRELLLGSGGNDICTLAEFFLFCAARAQMIEDVVKKELADRDVLLCDRYIDSTLVYQGMAMGLGYERVLDVMELFWGEFFPQLTIMLDSSLENVVNRIDMNDRIENRGREFIEKVLNGFRRLPDLFPERVVVVDSNRSLDEVVEDVWEIISARL